MNDLYKILKQIYPNRDFLIRQDIEQQDKEKINSYLLYIEDRETEEFETYEEIENYIYNLAITRSIKDAEDIKKGKDPYEID